MLAIAQDYDAYARIFATDVMSARIVQHRSASEMLVDLRLRQKKIITVTYDTYHAVRSERLISTRVFSMAEASWIREIGDVGKSGEHESPEGGGYLWHIQTGWRYEQVDDGVFMENERLILTRRGPLLLRPIVGPLVRNGRRDGVQQGLNAVRRAIERRCQ